MFSKKKNSIFSNRPLILTLTAIHITSLLFAFFFTMFFLLKQYEKQEQSLAHKKLLQYWIVAQSKHPTNTFIRILQQEYKKDIQNSAPYGLRITNKKHYQLLFLYPQSWIQYNINNITLPTEDYNIQQPFKISTSNNNFSTLLKMYTISFEDYYIQIFVSNEEKNILFENTLRIIIPLLIIVMILSFFSSILLLQKIIGPIYRINTLAEHIVTNQDITKRLPEDSSSMLYELEKTINTMLNTISRLVQRLRNANINLGHDIRTPLTRIKNNLETMSYIASTSKMKNHIELCLNSIDELQHLSKQVLDLSEIESGLVKIPKNPIHIKKTVENVIEMYEYIASEQGVEFVVNINTSAYISIDSIRLKQLVGNLLDNAIKFTPKGKKVILNIDIIENLVSIKVADEGVGIAEDDIPNIWNLSWKKNKYIHNKKSGSGVGLNIVKSIVDAYRGNIDVHSQKNSGSIFNVTFPYKHKQK